MRSRAQSESALRRRGGQTSGSGGAAGSLETSDVQTCNDHEHLLSLLRKRQENDIIESCANDPLLSRAVCLRFQPTFGHALEQQQKQECVRRVRQEVCEKQQETDRVSQSQSRPHTPFRGRSASLGPHMRIQPPMEGDETLRQDAEVSPRFRGGHAQNRGSTTPRGAVGKTATAASLGALATGTASSSTASAAGPCSSTKDWFQRVISHASETEMANATMYLTHSAMFRSDGSEVPLQNRHRVCKTLHELNLKVVTPLCRHFNLRYDFLFEQHCQEKKAGVARREPRTLRKRNPDGTMRQETRYIVTIRLRVRVHPSRGDPHTEFLSQGAQLAVLLHELCHLRYMDHGRDFMLLLRDMFREATRLGVFNPEEMTNELPSSAPWENEIFRTGGEMDPEELQIMYAGHSCSTPTMRSSSVRGVPSQTPPRCRSEVGTPRANVERQRQPTPPVWRQADPRRTSEMKAKYTRIMGTQSGTANDEVRDLTKSKPTQELDGPGAVCEQNHAAGQPTCQQPNSVSDHGAASKSVDRGPCRGQEQHEEGGQGKRRLRTRNKSRQPRQPKQNAMRTHRSEQQLQTEHRESCLCTYEVSGAARHDGLRLMSSLNLGSPTAVHQDATGLVESDAAGMDDMRAETKDSELATRGQPDEPVKHNGTDNIVPTTASDRGTPSRGSSVHQTRPSCLGRKACESPTPGSPSVRRRPRSRGQRSSHRSKQVLAATTSAWAAPGDLEETAPQMFEEALKPRSGELCADRCPAARDAVRRRKVTILPKEDFSDSSDSDN